MLRKPSVEVVIPVYNEEKQLKKSILKLYNFFKKSLNDFFWEITIADNASTDKTAEIGKRLSSKFKEVNFVHLPQKGRGKAVKKVWKRSDADILSYMDVDLSTDLKHFPHLVRSLVAGFDMAIGSRLLPGSRVYNRTLKREIISRGYNILIKLLFSTHFSDAQCGFKAITKNAAQELLPYVKDNEWFMDTELLIIGEKAGFKIYEEPVTWRDDPGTTVNIIPTVIQDLKGLWRLFWQKPWRKIKS